MAVRTRTTSSPAPSLVPNSLGRGSLVLGDRWNLLILREAFRGARRFNEWTARLDVSDPVLSARLRDLTELGLLHRVPSESTANRPQYRLTEPAKDMWQIFVAIWLWNLRWTLGTSAAEAQHGPHRPRLRHDDCGFAISPLLGCGHCRARGVTPFETSVVRHPGYSYAEGNPPRPYRRIQSGGEIASTDPDAIELLGDRWSTSVLAASFLGAHRFGDFGRDIGGISPLILTRRLGTFVDARVLIQRPVSAGSRRLEYHLTAKGSDFFGIFSNEITWSSSAFPDRDGAPLVIQHLPCGKPFRPIYVCNACDRALERRRVRFEYPEDDATTNRDGGTP